METNIVYLFGYPSLNISMLVCLVHERISYCCRIRSPYNIYTNRQLAMGATHKTDENDEWIFLNPPDNNNISLVRCKKKKKHIESYLLFYQKEKETVFVFVCN